jgi:methylmalonyl-CoA mutase N-terminal domain/subunit
MKSHRDAAKVEAALAQVKVAAVGDANLMPAIIDAVDAYATLGEVCDVLRAVFGEYRPDASF